MSEEEKTTKLQELNEEDFLHALAYSYEALIESVRQAIKDKKLPNHFMSKIALLCHKTVISDFKKRFGEIKDVQFHF